MTTQPHDQIDQTLHAEGKQVEVFDQETSHTAQPAALEEESEGLQGSLLDSLEGSAEDDLPDYDDDVHDQDEAEGTSLLDEAEIAAESVADQLDIDRVLPDMGDPFEDLEDKEEPESSQDTDQAEGADSNDTSSCELDEDSPGSSDNTGAEGRAGGPGGAGGGAEQRGGGGAGSVGGGSGVSLSGGAGQLLAGVGTLLAGLGAVGEGTGRAISHASDGVRSYLSRVGKGSVDEYREEVNSRYEEGIKAFDTALNNAHDMVDEIDRSEFAATSRSLSDDEEGWEKRNELAKEPDNAEMIAKLNAAMMEVDRQAKAAGELAKEAGAEDEASAHIGQGLDDLNTSAEEGLTGMSDGEGSSLIKKVAEVLKKLLQAVKRILGFGQSGERVGEGESRGEYADTESAVSVEDTAESGEEAAEERPSSGLQMR